MKLILFVNGYTHGCKPYEAYWSEKGSQFLDAADSYFGGGCTFLFINGEAAWYTGAVSRFRKGKQFAEAHFPEKFISSHEATQFFFVTHSMGAAYAEGMIEVLHARGATISKIVHFSVADAAKIRIPSATKHIPRVQLGMTGDKTISRHANPFTHYHKYKIPGVETYGEVVSQIEKMHPKVSPKDRKNWNFHYDTKTFAEAWNYVRVLEELTLKKEQNGAYRLVNPESKYPIFRMLFKNDLFLELNSDSQDFYKEI